MGWPKGVPRKGYIKKDGTPHAKKGAHLEVQDVQPEVRTDDVPVVSEEVQVGTTVSPEWSPSHYEGDIHGASGTGAITEVCPKCGYAYADGGYCPDCGWMRSINLLPYGGAGSGRIGRA